MVESLPPRLRRLPRRPDLPGLPGRTHLRRALTAVAAAGAALALCAPAASAAGGPVVTTTGGRVQGTTAAGVDSFLGIPYAAPPTGPRRFAPPQPAAPWTGVRQADHYGNPCPALVSSNGPRSTTEDCLFVNVQRPTGLATGARRPVLVFIHGGGLQNGTSAQNDNAALVARTGVVGVSLNYRLGVFGFLAGPGLPETAGNAGFLDQQAALRWVHDNVAAFGGDPAQVTIDGESAGGWSVCGHLSAPGSAGLFAQAVIQSGSCPSRTEAAARATGAQVARAVGCTDAATAPACLRALPAGRLLDATPADPPVFVRGTAALPQDPRTAVATGHFARVPVVVGANRDEGRTFQAGAIGWTQAQYTAWVRQGFGAQANAVLAHYPWPADAGRFTGAYLSGAVVTDSGAAFGIGGCSNRALTQDLARYTTTYAYQFDARTGPGLVPPLPRGYLWGAGHAAELAYVWPSFDNGTPIAATFDAGERTLARQMKDDWGSFVLRGHPSAAGQPAWPAYGADQQTMSLRPGGDSLVVGDARISTAHQCAFWAGLTG